MPNYSIEMPASLESLRIVAPFTTAVLSEIPEIPGRDKLMHDLALVASEALTNALLHGELDGAPVTLSYSVDSDGIVITVTDHGAGFDLNSVALPDFEESPEGGYGIYIIKTIMDDVSYERTPLGNNLILKKNWIGHCPIPDQR